jgi:hypothetical protein
MSAIRMLSSAALAIVVIGGVACSKDSSTGPNHNGNGISFDTWPANVNSTFCVQGTSLLGDNKSGSITVDDCDAAGIDESYAGYFEVWRIKVASSQVVTFDASSGFDNTLSVWRVNSVSSSRVNVSLLAQDDDRSSSDTNALLSVQLDPNVDYVVAVGGYDYSERGTYTLRIR